MRLRTGTERIQNGYENAKGMGTERIQNGNGTGTEWIWNGYRTVTDQKNFKNALPITLARECVLENAY